MKLITLFVASWLAGVFAYGAALYLLFGEVASLSSGDTTAVLFWSFASFALVYALLYLPLLRILRRRLGGVRPLWPFPLLATIVGIVPVALIVAFNGGTPHAMFSAESTLFYILFGTIGVVTGVGYAIIQRPAEAA